MTHRIFTVTTSGHRVASVIALHPAGVTPERFAKLIGPLPAGFDLILPESANDLRWDHLGNTDAPFLRGLASVNDPAFLCGYSSGAFMAMRMLQEAQFLAVMTVAGGLLKTYAAKPLPYPCPAMLIHGTEDKRVPYNGSAYVLGALETAQALKRLLGVPGGASGGQLPNTAADGCRAYVDTWGADQVRLYTVVNGGHTWPGSHLNPLILGKVCHDFSATAQMWGFFRGKLAA